MIKKVPQYLLLTAANSDEDRLNLGGTWSFILQRLGSEDRVEIEEYEPNIRGDRLQLLAVVRGLESLEQPANVTLITGCKYVGRGIRHHLRSWRENGWQWERFGEMVAVKNHDLWMRIERAMNIHQVTCRIWEVDSARKLAECSAITVDDGNDPSRSRPGRSRTPGAPLSPLVAATKYNWLQAINTIRTTIRRNRVAGKYGFSG